jgi:holliday junction DNA helicase RuvB
MDYLEPGGWMGFEEFLRPRFEEPPRRRQQSAVAMAPPPVTPIGELPSASKLTPTAAPESGNALRPATFAQIVGQERVKRQIERMTEVAERSGRPLDHVLLVGPSGTGKTTFAHVIARRLGTRVFQLEAPISHDTLVELSRSMQDGDILFLDEIHQQAIADRRGRQSATQPEVLFSVMEDRTLPTGTGVLPFPHITLIGATTDEGLLPDAFVNRFPLRPRLEPYSVRDMEQIAYANAEALGLRLLPEAAEIFAKASRNTPREMNNYLRNAAMLGADLVTRGLALEVLELNGISEDGLTMDMQAMLRYLLTQPRYVRATAETRYQASVSSIATAIGKSRDVKAIQLRVEPYLIQRGYVQVIHGGRILTTAGIARARQLESLR